MATGVNKTTQINTKTAPALQRRGDMGRIAIREAAVEISMQKIQPCHREGDGAKLILL